MNTSATLDKPVKTAKGKPAAKGPAAPRRAAKASTRTVSPALLDATRRPRIAIEQVTPSVAPQAGRTFCAKRVVGERVEVEADLVCDGHDTLAACVAWRRAVDADWQTVPMRLLGNDRWQAHFEADQVGLVEFTVEAWVDEWASHAAGLRKKYAAGMDVTLEIEEGRLHLAGTDGLDSEVSRQLTGIAQRLAEGSADDRAARVDLLLAPSTQALVQQVGRRPHLSRLAPSLFIDVERKAAAFASWYELFPRSQTDDATRHGRFDDVIQRLPDIAAMGFDVLYFPPIHPIGRLNRKGRNNSLRAQPGDPGSPYAIGSAEGGHEAIHPELGSVEDFERLRAAAAEQGLELALDFAVQCAPDHPWLKEHPEWFAWRPDGSMKYAENPPKKYEDIVNVDFYAEGAVPALWLALRDIVLLWAERGVKMFRVDNPHTKPLPFWEWLIADVRAKHPDAMFLAEAFTRPKMMYRLAKIGFSQSYTYFTWRNHKAEITDYLTELSTTEAREVYRPHFFVNTPDINPYFLQTSGRPGFLIRAALATMLSGLWGMVAGYELCEAEPVPGKEEFLDSEKYEIKPRDWARPNNIKAEITRLNRIRRENPALQTHTGVRFYNAWNDKILYFGKATPDRSNFILVAVNLDPHQAQEAHFEVPLWEFGLADHATIECEDLMRPSRFTWQGKVQHLRLDPLDLPFVVWRLVPPAAPSPLGAEV
jgi:starch synthase (maltosyl-transferring)